ASRRETYSRSIHQPMTGSPPDKLTEDRRHHLREAWKTSEDVAMHFNNLLLGFRLKSVGGIAAGAVLGFGLKVGELAHWGVIFAIFVALTMIWVLVWAADFFYYYPLLAGAVDELLRLEKELGDIRLSHLIERRVQRHGPPPKGDTKEFMMYMPRYPG